MSIKTASTRMEGLVALFDLQSDLLHRALDGIKEEDMYKRLDTQANHMAWLTGSLVGQRFMMTSTIHPELKQRGAELFAQNKGIQEGATYPTIADYLHDWKMITPFAREAMMQAKDEWLDSDFEMEGMKMKWMDMTLFTLYREASIIGQLALWRRLLGYPALKYD